MVKIGKPGPPPSYSEMSYKTPILLRIFDLKLFRFDIYALSVPEFIATYRAL